MSDENTISRRSGYTAIPNSIFSDERLTLEARAFLGLLMSMNDGRVFRRANLLKASGIGRDKYQRILRELQDVGYLEVVASKSSGGLFSGKKWIIHDTPETHAKADPSQDVVADADGEPENPAYRGDGEPEKPCAGFSGRSMSSQMLGPRRRNTSPVARFLSAAQSACFASHSPSHSPKHPALP